MDKVVTRVKPILRCRNMCIHHRHRQRDTFQCFVRPLQLTERTVRTSYQYREYHDDAFDSDNGGGMKRGKHEMGGEDVVREKKLFGEVRRNESTSSSNYQGNIAENVPASETSTINETSVNSLGSGASNYLTRASVSSSGESTVHSSSDSSSIKNNSRNGASEERLHSSDSKRAKGEPPVAPDPETCCESGCVNCVWIKYAEEVKDYYPDHEERLKEILDMIEDYNVKMFVRMELGMKK